MIRSSWRSGLRDLARPPTPSKGESSVAVSLLIPARGASHSLPDTARAAHAFLTQRYGSDFELILIPNPAPGNDRDASIAIATELCHELPCASSVIHSLPEGKGAALRSGFLAARGRQIWFTDADLPYDLEFFDRARHEIERGYGLVAGNRRLASSVFDLPVSLLKIAHQRHRLGLAFNRFARLMLPLRTTDTQAGIKAMSRSLADEAFARQRCPGFFFDLEFFLTAQRLGYPSLGLPVTLRLNSEKTTVRVLRESALALYWMIRITWLNHTSHYGKKISRPKAPPSYYRDLPIPTRIFLWLRWWLTPYSDMAAEFAPRGRFLDLGCGHGLFSILLARSRGRQVIALDHDPERVRIAQAATKNPSLQFGTVNLVQGVPKHVDPTPELYDGIALIDVLHYFPLDQQLRILKTAREALAPGGKIIFREVDPNAGIISRLNRAYEWIATSTGFTRSEKKAELHFHTREEWEHLLSESGFGATSRRCSSLIFADVLFVGVKQ